MLCALAGNQNNNTRNVVDRVLQHHDGALTFVQFLAIVQQAPFKAALPKVTAFKGSVCPPTLVLWLFAGHAARESGRRQGG